MQLHSNITYVWVYGYTQESSKKVKADIFKKFTKLDTKGEKALSL